MKILDKVIKVDGVVKHQSPSMSYFGKNEMSVRIVPLSSSLKKNDWFYLRIYDTDIGNRTQIENHFQDVITYLGVDWKDIFNYIKNKI
jgi:hypothetical protein